MEKFTDEQYRLEVKLRSVLINGQHHIPTDVLRELAFDVRLTEYQRGFTSCLVIMNEYRLDETTATAQDYWDACEYERREY